MTLEPHTFGTVSVVITTYDRPDYLHQALQSVLAQTHPIEQIIVVDDCSPISVQEGLEHFLDERILYERLAVNSGANHARNRGIKLATSHWIAFLDDDDAWLPEKLETQLRTIQSTPNEHPWSGALCSYRFMETAKDRLWGRTGKVELETLKTGNPYCGASGLIVKNDVISALKFDEDLPCGQDWDIFVRLSQHGALLYLATPLLLYRRGSHDSVTVKAKKIEIANLAPRLAAIYKHKSWLGDIAFKRRIANQTLAYVWHKPRPMQWIKESIRLAGWRATLRALWLKLNSRLVNKFSAQRSRASKRKVSL